MAYQLPPLPYPEDALEPHIDAQTMSIHHDRHHKTYVDKANAALEGTEWADEPAEVVIQHLDELPEDIRGPVRNNAGGHANHSLFWTVMSPDGGGAPEGELAAAIDAAFGDFASFQEQFAAAAANRFGSGWAWLVWDGSGVAITSTPNKDNTLTEGKIQLLGVDVWEHAYYLKYQNKRPDYVSAWWNVVNWSEVARRFEIARA
ncbi:MAG: superoxide dismutase, Fe-Mn family [Miltoncostaeaceae bacterium]|nr:superoxide dismutase, Fe-Mn family [Miltoncostaeaceae bacterium]